MKNDISFNEWLSVIQEHFPELTNAAIVCASVIAQIKIKDVKNPCALGLIDVPSSGKTITLNFFSQLEEITYFSDNFSPAAFVSHAANVKKDKLKDIDLLPRIKNKTLIVPELAPLFGARDDDLLKNFGILTRVLDGEGLQTDTGIHGQRGYTDVLFMFLAGSTPIPPRVWKVMGTLGSRLFFYAIRSSEKTEKELIKQLKLRSWKEKQLICKETTTNYINSIWRKYPEGIDWQRINDSDEILSIIVRCAKLLARLRAPINVYKEQWSAGQNEYTHTVPIIEKPDRINQVLYNLARGHSLICGRTKLTEVDLGLVLDITFDSCQNERAKLIRLLIENGGSQTTSDLTYNLRVSDESARKVMEAFKILDIANISEQSSSNGRPQFKLTLNKEFEWFLSDECKNLYINSTPSESVGKDQPDSFPSKSDTEQQQSFSSEIEYSEDEQEWIEEIVKSDR